MTCQRKNAGRESNDPRRCMHKNKGSGHFTAGIREFHEAFNTTEHIYTSSHTFQNYTWLRSRPHNTLLEMTLTLIHVMLPLMLLLGLLLLFMLMLMLTQLLMLPLVSNGNLSLSLIERQLPYHAIRSSARFTNMGRNECFL